MMDEFWNFSLIENTSYQNHPFISLIMRNVEVFFFRTIFCSELSNENVHNLCVLVQWTKKRIWWRVLFFTQIFGEIFSTPRTYVTIGLWSIEAQIHRMHESLAIQSESMFACVVLLLSGKNSVTGKKRAKESEQRKKRTYEETVKTAVGYWMSTHT